MSLNPSSEERLEILRGADQGRDWRSLDDERVCPLCGKSIRGREIIIRSNSTGPFQLQCPTPGCEATIDVPSRPEQKSSAVVRTVEMDFSNW